MEKYAKQICLKTGTYCQKGVKSGSIMRNDLNGRNNIEIPVESRCVIMPATLECPADKQRIQPSGDQCQPIYKALFSHTGSTLQ